jgi:mono/diheme cytochrome c family protein
MNKLIILLVAISINKTPKNIADSSLYQEKTLNQSIAEGKWIYQDFCARCHLPDGNGVEGVYPPLNNSNWLTDKIRESIVAVKYGLKGEIVVNDKTYKKRMPKPGLSDEEVADVMNYIMNSWDNIQNEMITTKRVMEIEN